MSLLAMLTSLLFQQVDAKKMLKDTSLDLENTRVVLFPVDPRTPRVFSYLSAPFIAFKDFIYKLVVTTAFSQLDAAYT
jgi:hypothetical protein